MTYIDLAGNFNRGWEASAESRRLAASIAGQKAQQQIERDRMAQEREHQRAIQGLGEARALGERNYQEGELELGRAKSAREAMLSSAQAEYFKGKNPAMLAAAASRAGASIAGKDMAAISSQLKEYDMMRTIDPDGSKGIYTPELAQLHGALRNTFMTKQGIAIPPDEPVPTPAPAGWRGAFADTGAALAGGARKVADYFTGFVPNFGDRNPPPPAAPAPISAPSYQQVRKDRQGNRWGLNARNQWEKIGGR